MARIRLGSLERVVGAFLKFFYLLDLALYLNKDLPQHILGQLNDTKGISLLIRSYLQNTLVTRINLPFAGLEMMSVRRFERHR